MSGSNEEPEDAGIAEGGGSGGGSEAVHEERRRISPARGPALVIALILAIVFIIFPVFRIIGSLLAGTPIESVWIIMGIIAVAIAAFALYFMFKKNV